MMRHSITIADGCAYGSQSGTASCNNELPTRIAWLAFVGSIEINQNSWRSELSVTIADVVLIGHHQATKLGQRIAVSNRGIGVRRLKQNQLRILNCLRLPRRSVTIAEFCAYGAQSDNKTEPTNCWFESRDWRSLGQPRGIKTIEFWIVCVHRDIQ